MSLNRFLYCIFLFLLFADKPLFAQFPRRNLNIIVFTADDLGGGDVGVGAFGGKMKGLTPQIDKIATQGIRFANMHVNSAICVPSRAVLGTGKYNFNNGQYGFFQAPDTMLTIIDVFQKNGYKAGILGKLPHSSIKLTTKWDYAYDEKDLGAGRSPKKYYELTKQFIENCKTSHTPFYFMINSHDPHRPFQKPDGELLPGAEWPSKLFTPAQSFVPGFLPKLPEVKEELSWYYNSVRRLDDTFGEVMRAVRESGLMNNTIFMFFSDNGISMPFAKANCYLASTRTPFFAYMPGVIKPRLDKEHVVSTVDLFPTIMEMTGIVTPPNLDGSSILPILLGKKQPNKNMVLTEIDYLNSDTYYPMRCIQDKKFGYIFSPWANGKKIYKNGNEGNTFKAMEANKNDTYIQKRVRMFRYREVEEFYDLQKDPDCLNNLANKKEFLSVKLKYRELMQAKMKSAGDPLLSAIRFVNEPDKLQAEIESIYKNQLKKGPIRIP